MCDVAVVVQRIERGPPKSQIRVRFLSRAPPAAHNSLCTKNTAVVFDRAGIFLSQALKIVPVRWRTDRKIALVIIALASRIMDRLAHSNLSYLRKGLP